MTIIHYTYNIIQEDIISDYIVQIVSYQKRIGLKVEVVTNLTDLKKIINKERVDILHIHGCWDYNAYICAKEAKKNDSAIIVSPHWQLNYIIRKKEKPMRKILYTFFYQRKLIKMADSIIVTANKEKEEIKKELHWNKKIEVIPTNILNSQVAEQTVLEYFKLVYNKIIDTRYRIYMGEDTEIRSILDLLYIGLQKNDESIDSMLPSENILKLKKLTITQWKRILLMADDENIRDYIDIAIEKLKIETPNINTKEIIRYYPNNPKDKNNLENEDIIVSIFIKREKIENTIQDETEAIKKITTMIVNSNNLIKTRKFTLRHLANIYREIRFSDYNEDKLYNIVRKINTLKLSRHIIYILSSWLYLEEGFRPFKYLSNKRTVKIINNIINKYDK